MGIFNPSFLLGLVILLYLASFVVLAIIRIATGVSIQRLGYFSLRRIAYTPREGIRFDLRALGLHLHRPTFAQPTWVSLRLEELKVTVDVKALTSSKTQTSTQNPAKTERSLSSSSASPKPILRRKDVRPSRSRAWKRLTGVKEKLKRLHEMIYWLRLVDVLARNSSLVIANVGTFEIGTLMMVVDTRRKTIDRGRLFRHKKVPAGDQRPAEWMFTVKGVLFTAEGKDSLDLVDIATLNIHGLLYKDLPGLRDTSVALKLGRIHIPYDDFLGCHERIKELQSQANEKLTEDEVDDFTISDLIEEYDRPGTREANIVQAVSDSKEFISSILRGIQEIQMAVSFVGMTKAFHSIQPSGAPLYLNISLNEFGIDMHRLDPKSPAHRMYFSSKDIAHQALLAAISISVGLDAGRQKPERLLYIPMATTTIKTTLPSKTVSFSEDRNAAERNANMLFANFVVTSPSVDVDPKHVPLVLALVQRRQERSKVASPKKMHSHHLLQRLLPKANVKMSIHEPVIRITLPPADPRLQGTDDYDMLICAVSSVSLDTESSHSSAGQLHYALTSTLRLVSHQFYYHTAAGERHNLLLTDALELKLQLTASPEVCMTATGNVQTLSVHMVKPEISAGVRQIVQQLRSKSLAGITKLPYSPSKGRNFLRRLPTWLAKFSLQGSNFGVEVAGVDPGVSKDTRGIALQLESWTAEYKLQKTEPDDRPPSRRHARKKSAMPGDPSMVTPPPSKSKDMDSTDGRRLAIHVRALDGSVVEGIDALEPEPFLSLPRFEIAFTTSSDVEGAIFHVNSFIKALYVHYSLYRYYSIGVAAMVLRNAFASDAETTVSRSSSTNMSQVDQLDVKQGLAARSEIVTVDVKAELLQIKAKMPADPNMMLQIYSMEAGQHRWARPFLRSQLVRLYAESPQLPLTWARIVSLKGLRFDLREIRRKRGVSILEEKLFDITTDFIRLAVPHQMVMHKVFDNFVNVTKATAQLQHRFKTGTNEYILNKKPARPKVLPRISIRSKAMLFDIEDGPFDWRLGMIYRIGLIEQKQRLAREDAFYAKLKHLDKPPNQGSSRYRNQSGHGQQREGNQRSQSEHQRGRGRSPLQEVRQQSVPPHNRRSRWMRYDPEGKCDLSKEAKESPDNAWRKLQRYNAQSWKKRIDGAYRSQNRGMQDIRGIFWGADEIPTEESSERILAMPERPGLMSTLVSDLHVILDKPSFSIDEYPEYLYSVGKGMPRHMEYSFLLPMHVQIDMGEARITLRDYPLPLLHVPAIRPGQSPRLPSWSLKTDFVISEEYRGDMSSMQVQVEVIPASKFLGSESIKGFAIDVRRTVSPLKTYSDVHIAINTNASTSITWGTSLQPAIQDMMMVIEGFSKPQVDPSDRTGFWDKIRLSVHSRVSVVWTGDGDVRLNLKGSRDPYIVTGHGAGFVMVWRKDVRWNIHRDDDPKKFMSVESGEYVLAIPDFSRQAREHSSLSDPDSASMSISSNSKNSAHFKKTIMKLSGDVKWMAGLVFERDLGDGGRSFEFRPHYDITLMTPKKAAALQDQEYDAFKGFRSNHIHLSIAVFAPHNRDWTTTNTVPSMSYNSVHMTPKFFTHFFDWWSMFSGVMSLPIRQGKLFPGLEKTSKKFGRHLATIKYNLLLSPLFMTHMYKHKEVEEYSEDVVSATGLKLRLDSFMLDLHQRREEFAAQGKGRIRQIKTSAMKINQAQLDFISADMRAISAKIMGTTTENIKNATDEELAALQQPTTMVDLSRFTIPDNDFDWVDMDDFNELDWILPTESTPETKILPMAYAPRFTYFRQTDHLSSPHADDNRSSSFGDEVTHFCVMSQDNDPRKVQCQLIKQRLSKLEQEIEAHERVLGEQELHVIRDSNKDSTHKDRYDILTEQGKRLQQTKFFLLKMLDRLTYAADNDKPWVSTAEDPANHDFDNGNWQDDGSDTAKIESSALGPPIGNFNNRFIIHNMQLKWTNSLRNIILRYVHQVGQRRGFIYYLTRRAVKFILDIVEEQNRNKQRHAENAGSPSTKSNAPASGSPGTEEDDGSSVAERIQELLNDGKRFVDADDHTLAEELHLSSSSHHGDDLSKDFKPLNSYHVRLITPQIQLQSEKNAKSVLLVTAKSMQLQVIQIMDKDRMADDVSGLVQRRFSVDMDSVQFFVTSAKSLLKDYHDIYLGNRYGAPQGSSWPPWVPLEVNFDFNFNPLGWSRVVSKTSASLRYDKYNTLRLKYNDEVSGGKGETIKTDNLESRIDHLWVDFPHIRAICDSAQYYTMYVIVLDLLLYNEPLEKVRSEKLEKIMLASDFSDLRGTPEMVMNLQRRIRQLEEMKNHFQIHRKYLDRQGWLDSRAIEQDLASCEDELFFMMKAITTSQRKYDDRTEASQSSGLLRWYLSASEIVWHLMRQKDEPLMEIQLNNALYDRTDNSDGSNHNTIEIERIRGLNLLPGAIYPEMLGPYLESGRKFLDGQDPKMLKIKWHSLEAIAGIPVLDQFEVDLFPLKVQLEREIGQKLFEYIFPGVTKNGNKEGTFSPLVVKKMVPGGSNDDESDLDTAASVTSTPRLTLNGVDGDHYPPRPASLEMRLRATTQYPNNDGLTSSVAAAKHKVAQSGGERHFRFFQHSSASNRSQQTIPRSSLMRNLANKASQESLTLPQESRGGSSTSLSTMNGSVPEKHRRFGMVRPNTPSTFTSKDKPSDDLSLMLSRASNYMTLAYVKIPSVVLCLSYKGRGERNIEDLHNFVFRMPVLEYRNKTWSNLDLALRLKKDIIRALISHTGAIIGNKFSHHRLSKQQQSRLQDSANTSLLGSNTNALNNSLESETSSMSDKSRMGNVSRSSITSAPHSELSGTESFASSVRNPGMSNANGNWNLIPKSEAESDQKPLRTMRQNITRRFTGETQQSRSRESGGANSDDPDERYVPSKPTKSKDENNLMLIHEV
ncbi:MAG: hypothetical protein Q9163_004948 [Psora crenata]